MTDFLDKFDIQNLQENRSKINWSVMNPLHGTRELLAPSYGFQSACNWSIHFDLNLFFSESDNKQNGAIGIQH